MLCNTTFLSLFRIVVPGPGPSQVEVTRFEDLEETQTEVRLKQNLWNAQGEWEVLQETWSTVSLHVGGQSACGCGQGRRVCMHTLPYIILLPVPCRCALCA